MLVIDGLTTGSGERRAPDGLSIEVPPGQVVGLLGIGGRAGEEVQRLSLGDQRRQAAGRRPSGTLARGS